MRSITHAAFVVIAVAAMTVVIGCPKKSQPASEASDQPATGEKPAAVKTGGIGPGSSAVPVDMSLGWCGGHGVPESVCTRCNSALIPRFKQAGDWCAEHGLPESQCTVCHPEVAAKWEELNPAPPGDDRGDDRGDDKPDDRGDDPRDDRGDDRRGDASSTPGSGLDIGGGGEPGKPGVRIERAARLVSAENDPLCAVENLRVRFIDPSILTKAGIVVEPVRRRRMSATIVVPAEVEFDATRVTRVRPRIPGVVREVAVSLGDTVEAGAVLAIIDSPVLGEAKSAYIEHRQDLRLAEADLERFQTIHRGVRQVLEVCLADSPMDAVREALADTLVGEAKAKLLRAHATLHLARTEEARQATLLEKSIASERDYQSAQGARAAGEAEFAALREEIAFDIERERIAVGRGVEIARGAAEASDRKLHILGLTEGQIDAIGNEPDEQLSRYEMRSPVAGRVIERGLVAGESVGTEDVPFVLADLSTMWLLADVLEGDLVRLGVGLAVVFTVDGMPGVHFEGAIRWIDSAVNDRTRTVRVRADLPNPDGWLRARMFGTARIVLRDNENVVSVPRESVQTDGCCQLVFVRESDTAFLPRKVVLGSDAGGYVEILRGLREGERVAAAGSFLMKTEILKSSIGAGCCDVDPGR
jgi:cobalt-zinc-cadmium efflux system membrane fusion protein